MGKVFSPFLGPCINRTCGKGTFPEPRSKGNACWSLVPAWSVYHTVTLLLNECAGSYTHYAPALLAFSNSPAPMCYTPSVTSCLITGALQGLGGIAFSMLGADVLLTDTADVLPLLRRNCESNLGCGVVAVEELGQSPSDGWGLGSPFPFPSVDAFSVTCVQIGLSRSK